MEDSPILTLIYQSLDLIKNLPISIILLNKVSNVKLSEKDLRLKVYLLSSVVGRSSMEVVLLLRKKRASSMSDRFSR